MRLSLLDFGAISSRTADGTAHSVPVPGAVIETERGYVLVDTGMPPRFVDHPTPFPNSPSEMTPIMAVQNTATAQLELLGLRPPDIAAVICTHFDWDHVGMNAAFPDATFYVQREHLADAARNPRYWRDLWELPGITYVAVDGDAEPLPGVHLLETSGHVRGHQSVAVRLAKTGLVVLAIDAVKSAEQLQTAHWEGPDVARSQQSGERLAAMISSTDAGLLVFGHDQNQWASLAHAPAWYD